MIADIPTSTICPLKYPSSTLVEPAPAITVLAGTTCVTAYPTCKSIGSIGIVVEPYPNTSVVLIPVRT